MTRPRSIRGDDLRRALAQEAARLMFEHGVDDYGVAKRKAAERFGATDTAALPKNAEIDAALAEYQRLFAADTHTDTLTEQRRAALDAMQMLDGFEPRLVGPVLTGTATPHQEISLHVFADFPEAVSLRLLDERIQYRIAEHRLRMNADRVLPLPVVQFSVHDIPVEATVFPKDGIRQSPLSPSDGKPMRRAGSQEVRSLLGPEEPAATNGFSRAW
ncbi:MAG: hypothetical protein WCH32_00525 [Pseudomonadota bacterium]